MAQKLKRWESPRYEGRNNKGRGGSARYRQIRKQQQLLRKKLKQENNGENKKNGNRSSHSFLCVGFYVGLNVRTNSSGNTILWGMVLPTCEYFV